MGLFGQGERVVGMRIVMKAKDAVSIVSFCWTVLVHISHIICFPRDEIKTKRNKQEDANGWSLNSNFYYLSVSGDYY